MAFWSPRVIIIYAPAWIGVRSGYAIVIGNRIKAAMCTCRKGCETPDTCIGNYRIIYPGRTRHDHGSERSRYVNNSRCRTRRKGGHGRCSSSCSMPGGETNIVVIRLWRAQRRPLEYAIEIHGTAKQYWKTLILGERRTYRNKRGPIDQKCWFKFVRIK